MHRQVDSERGVEELQTGRTQAGDAGRGQFDRSSPALGARELSVGRSNRRMLIRHQDEGAGPVWPDASSPFHDQPNDPVYARALEDGVTHGRRLLHQCRIAPQLPDHGQDGVPTLCRKAVQQFRDIVREGIGIHGLATGFARWLRPDADPCSTSRTRRAVPSRHRWPLRDSRQARQVVQKLSSAWQGRRRRHLIRHGVLAHDDDSGKARRRQNSKYRRHLSILSMTVTTEASAGRRVKSRQPRHPLGGRVVHLRGRRGLPRRPLATSGRTHPAPRRRVSGVGRRPALTLRWTPNHLRTSACRRRPFSCDARRCIANHYRRRANYLMVCTVCGG